jgi:AcrR family transcriptional regulator
MAERTAPTYRPRRKQSRSAPVMAKAVEAVAERLLTEDETLIRIPEICESTGVNYGSVYHHFGSREGLIDAAYNHLFEQTARVDVDKMVATAKTATTRDQFFAGMRDVLRASISDPGREQRRQMRVRILAASLVRPDLREMISETQDGVTDDLTEMVTIGQNNGWFRRDLDARAMAVMFQVVVIGRVLDDVSGSPVSEEQWGPVVANALGAFIARS